MQMEKENREVIENAEQKEDDSVKSNGKDRKKDRKWFTRIKAYIKKHPYRILAVILLCIVLFFVLRETGVISKHVYEEVENLGEREGVCFDNLLFSYSIGLNGESEYKYLCIFNTGDIYCFEWSESYPWDWYYLDSDHERGYDDTSWSNAENVIYLGRFSNWQTVRLNQYVQNYDIEGEYFSFYNEGPYEGQSSGGQSLQSTGNITNVWRWRSYSAHIYWHEQPEKNLRMDETIESCTMNYLFGDIIYEKGEMWYKSYEENALAALKVFESSLFYYRWVYMCLHS